MQHLSEEALARVADGALHPGEAEHLGVCEQCRGRMDIFRADLDALRSLPRLAPPQAEWDRLVSRAAMAASRRRPAIAFAALAAAGLVFMAGVLAGQRSSRGSRGSRAPTFATQSPASASEATARLAAFEAALLTTREAARHAPADPVLLAYERITVTARDSALRAVKLTSSKQWY